MSDFLTRELSTEEFVLDQLKVGAQTLVGRNAILHVEEDPSRLLGDLMVRLESSVAAERLVPDHDVRARGIIEFPASPWQFFKQRHLHSWWLGWLVKRRPVRLERHAVTTTGRVERYHTYPEATIRVPELGRPVIYERLVWE